MIDNSILNGITFRHSTKGVLKTDNQVVLLYVIKGEAEISIDREAYSARMDDILLINNNKSYAIRSRTPEMLIAEISLNYTEICRKMKGNRVFFLLNTVVNPNTDYKKIRGVIIQLLDVYYEDNQEDSFLFSSLINLLLHRLRDQYSESSIESKNIAFFASKNSREEGLIKYIANNYINPMTLSEVAEYFYVTPTYLSRYFKKTFGVSFTEYINETRLASATEELIHTKNSISKIANNNGFVSSSAFNRFFKNKYKMSPTEYREQKANEITAPTPESQEKEIEKSSVVKDFLERHKKSQAEGAFDKAKLFSVDVQNFSELKTPWKKVMNIGNAESLLESDVRNQVLFLCKELGFSHVRILNIIKLSTFKSSKENKYKVNFDRLDRVLDFLVENRIKPYIEMNNKPEQLIASNKELLTSDKNELIFDTPDEYMEYMKLFINHVVNRYSIDEVQSWYFEFWQDPKFKINQADGIYYSIFERAYQLLKQKSKKIQVGGAGFILGYENYSYVKALAYWQKRDIHPDFLSFYCYRYIMVEENGTLIGRTSLDEYFLTNQLRIVREGLSKIDFEVKKIHISEWNFTISNRNCINDSCSQAAYIVKTCLDSIDSQNILAYWHGTDLHSEHYDTGGLIYGDSGLLTKDSINKPSFYGFNFLNQLHSHLLGKSDNCIVTSSEGGEIVIVCHNFKRLTHKYLIKKEDEIKIDEQDVLYEELNELQLPIEIRNVEKGEYSLKRKRINNQYGSVQDIWRQMDFSKRLSRDELEYIKNMTVPYTELKKIIVDNASLNLNIDLQPHEITVLTLKKLVKE